MADGDQQLLFSSPGSVEQEDDVEGEKPDQDDIAYGSLRAFELGQENDNLKPAPSGEDDDNFTIEKPVFESDSESSGEEDDNEPVDIVNSPINTPEYTR